MIYIVVDVILFLYSWIVYWHDVRCLDWVQVKYTKFALQAWKKHVFHQYRQRQRGSCILIMSRGVRFIGIERPAPDQGRRCQWFCSSSSDNSFTSDIQAFDWTLHDEVYTAFLWAWGSMFISSFNFLHFMHLHYSSGTSACMNTHAYQQVTNEHTHNMCIPICLFAVNVVQQHQCEEIMCSFAWPQSLMVSVVKQAKTKSSWLKWQVWCTVKMAALRLHLMLYSDNSINTVTAYDIQNSWYVGVCFMSDGKKSKTATYRFMIVSLTLFLFLFESLYLAWDS